MEGLLHKEGNAQNSLKDLGNLVRLKLYETSKHFAAPLPTTHFSKAGEVNLYQKLKMQEEMGTKL